jgi:2-desacetyl-2-hydroxyethyl bacteriochlorophyllide A dehydrogenase
MPILECSSLRLSRKVELMETVSVVIPEPGKIELQKREVGEPGPGQILVRTNATLISTGTELTVLTGDYPPDSYWDRIIHYPWAGGYSNAGVVLQIGEGVSGFEVGQRIASFGAHSQYTLVRASDAQPIPDTISDEAATFWTLGRTVINGVRLAGIQMGEAVLLAGAGILSQLAVQFIRHSGGWPVMVVGRGERRIQCIQSLRYGATHTIRGLVGDADVHEQIRALTHERMVDVAFEVTGNPKVIPPLLKTVRRQGRVILLGSQRGPVEVDFHDEVNALGLHIIGAHVSTHPPFETPGNPWTAARNGQLFFDWLAAGMIETETMITHRFSWTGAPEAYQMLLHDRSQAVGVILDWRDDASA